MADRDQWAKLKWPGGLPCPPQICKSMIVHCLVMRLGPKYERSSLPLLRQGRFRNFGWYAKQCAIRMNIRIVSERCSIFRGKSTKVVASANTSWTWAWPISSPLYDTIATIESSKRTQKVQRRPPSLPRSQVAEVDARLSVFIFEI